MNNFIIVWAETSATSELPCAFTNMSESTEIYYVLGPDAFRSLKGIQKNVFIAK